MPLVSVVLIFLNEDRFIEEAVRSVREQTLTDWELILVDDGSTDRSTTVARDLAAADKRIRYIDHPGHENRGMSASRNFGVAHTTAPYVAFIDGDDVWVPTKLAEQVSLLESMPGVAMICGATHYWYSWDPASRDADKVMLTGGLADVRLDPPEAALTCYPLGRGHASGPEALFRRTVFDAVNGYEERFRGLLEDQAFLIKVFLRYPVYLSSRPWLRYRQHDDSCVKQAVGVEYWRVRKAFLDWLQEDPGRLADGRVRVAYRRSRRVVAFRTARARISGPVPRRLKTRVKRALGRVRQQISQTASSGTGTRLPPP